MLPLPPIPVPFVLLSLILLLAVKPYQVPSEAMEPTLEVGDRFLVNRTAYLYGDPEIGDIVVLHPPAGAVAASQCGVPHPETQACPEPTAENVEDITFVKRIVAGPGDTLAVADGHPVVSGVLAEEDFIVPCRPGGACSLPTEITIPPDHYFMMGDNRGASDDSRIWGPVPRDWLIGEAVGTYWPPGEIGIF